MKNLFSTSIIYLLSMINLQGQFLSPVIETGKLFTGYRDKWGESIGIGLTSTIKKKYSLEVNYIISVYNQKDDALLKQNTLFIDKDNTLYPFTADSEFIRALERMNGYKTSLGGINKYSFKQLDVKMGFKLNLFKYFEFNPSIGLSGISANVTTTNTSYNAFVKPPYGSSDERIPVTIVIPQIIRSIDYGWNYGFKLMYTGINKISIGIKFRDVYYKNSPFDNVSISGVCQYQI